MRGFPSYLLKICIAKNLSIGLYITIFSHFCLTYILGEQLVTQKIYGCLCFVILIYLYMSLYANVELETRSTDRLKIWHIYVFFHEEGLCGIRSFVTITVGPTRSKNPDRRFPMIKVGTCSE